MVAICLALVIVACTSTQQGVVLNSLSTLEQTATATYDGYLALVVKGTVPTNDVPKVSKLFNTFQSDMVLAVVAVQGNTNAVAPQNVIDDSTALINQITTSKGGK